MVLLSRHSIWVLLYVSTLLPAHAELQQNNTLPDLNIMGFLPMTSNLWSGGGACLPAIHIALRIANEREDILKGYNLRFIYKDSKCDPGVAANDMYEMLYEPPVKHFISGPGCSMAAEATARSSHMWNLTHLSWGAASPLLSNWAIYPRFFRVIPSDAFYNIAKVALLRHFNWKKVSTISVALDFFFAVTDNLLLLIKDTDIQIVTQEIFNGDPTQKVDRLKQLDARIIFLGGYENHARQILCAAYKAGLYGPKIVWFLPNWYGKNWWRPKGDITCTSAEMAEVVDGIILTGLFAHPPDIGEVEVGSSGISYQEFKELYYGHELYKPSQSKYEEITTSCFDSAFAAALALNCTDAVLKDIGHLKSLDQFSYRDIDIADIVTRCTNSLNFVGMTGRTDLTHRDAVKAVQITQIQGQVTNFIGIYDKVDNDAPDSDWHFKWVNGGLQWRAGYVPRDSTEVKVEEITVPVYMYATMSCLASLGIFLSLTLFAFNVRHRTNVIVKLSSPNINNILLLGCVCTYCNVFMQSYTGETILLCKLRTFTFVLGFSTAFGALFSKTWRVYRIFANKQLLRRNIQDSQLVGIVGALIGVISFVLILKEIIDPVTIETTFIESEMYLVGNDEEIRPYIRDCISQYSVYFSWTLYMIQGVLLIFGAFLSFETRRVKIAVLNDSRLIGLCLYNVVVLAAIGLTLTLVLDTQLALIYGITSGFIIFGTTATQLIVFIPKITAVYYPHHIETDVSTGLRGVNSKPTATSNMQTSSDRPNITPGEPTSSRSDPVMIGTDEQVP